MGCCILLIKDFDRTKPDTKIQNTKIPEYKIQKLEYTKIILLIKNFDPTQQNNSKSCKKWQIYLWWYLGNARQKLVHEPPAL